MTKWGSQDSLETEATIQKPQSVQHYFRAGVSLLDYSQSKIERPIHCIIMEVWEVPHALGGSTVVFWAIKLLLV